MWIAFGLLHCVDALTSHCFIPDPGGDRRSTSVLPSLCGGLSIPFRSMLFVPVTGIETVLNIFVKGLRVGPLVSVSHLSVMLGSVLMGGLGCDPKESVDCVGSGMWLRRWRHSGFPDV